jgi:hypothetical protein
MFNKMLVITLGVTGLSSVLLFLYFRNRIGQVEEKVDNIFQLIQNYEANKPAQFTVQENQQEYYEPQEEVINQDYVQTEQVNPNSNLIAVSDKNSGSESEESESEESESEESESDSESDNEEPKQLILEGNDNNVEVNNVEVNNVEELNDLDLVKKEIEAESLDKPKTLFVEENNDLEKLKVADLKNLCKEKGLGGYRNLRKSDLINLLSA